ncbi:hypothetical protein [Cupriavidus sp. D39]|nr:hypothetical protein [Cupriavidus sp. D39]MCY0857934.1 hypothetical protein [Cupriavidus sp. D39]
MHYSPRQPGQQKAPTTPWKTHFQQPGEKRHTSQPGQFDPQAAQPADKK